MAEPIAARVLRYLERHIAFYETSLGAVAALDVNSPEAVSAFLRDDARREAAAGQLDAEQAALLKEWRQGADESDAERAAVRSLAARAQALASELQRAYDEAGLLALRAAAVVELQANAARRGAGVATKFGHDASNAGGFVDWQA